MSCKPDIQLSHPAKKGKGARGRLVGSNKGQERRSGLLVTLLHIGIRIRYFFESWFFLKPILSKHLSAQPSFLRPKDFPEIDWFTCSSLKLLWYISATARTHTLILYIFLKLRIMHVMGWFHGLLMKRICNIMENSDINWEKARRIPIPEFDWKNKDPEDFYKLYGNHPHPVILRGFLNDHKIMQYTFDKMVDEYGEEEVSLTSPDLDGYPGKLNEVMNPKVYLHNSEVLFNKYPYLKTDLETERLEPYLKKKCGFSQFFVGRQGTGAPLHFAGTWNFFYMVDGTKTWYFVDPYDFYFIYPLWRVGNYAGSILPLYPDEVNEKMYPAVKYCPYYYADMQPGDVLLNPPWWGHGIRNTSDKSVGVATRWYRNGVVGENLRSVEDDYDVSPFASFLFFTGFNSFGMLQNMLYEPSPRFDEHRSMIEKNSRFIHLQKKRAEGKMILDGFNPTF